MSFLHDSVEKEPVRACLANPSTREAFERQGTPKYTKNVLREAQQA